MSRKADIIYVEVDWDLSVDSVDGVGIYSMKQAGVTRIVGIPADVFNDCHDVAPEDWVADWLSDKYDWCVNGWCFA